MVKEILWWNIKRGFLLFENLLNKLKTELITFLVNLKIISNAEKDNNFSQKQNEKFSELSSKKLEETSLVLVIQEKNINTATDLYKIKIKEKRITTIPIDK